MAGQPNLSDFSDLPGPVLELIFKSLINCPDCTVSFCRLSSVCKSWQQVLLSDIYWYSSDFVYRQDRHCLSLVCSKCRRCHVPCCRQSIKVPASYAASFTDCNLQALAARCHGRPLQLDLTGCKRLSTFAIMTLLFRNNSQLSEVRVAQACLVLIRAEG